MAVLHIILRKQSIILDSCLLNEVCRYSLLQKSITNVLLVSKDSLDGAEVPFAFFGTGLDSITLQSLSNITKAAALQVLPKKSAHNLGFFLINDEVAIGVLCISQEVVVVDLNLPILVAELKSKLYVL